MCLLFRGGGRGRYFAILMRGGRGRGGSAVYRHGRGREGGDMDVVHFFFLLLFSPLLVMRHDLWVWKEEEVWGPGGSRKKSQLHTRRRFETRHELSSKVMFKRTTMLKYVVHVLCNIFASR